MALCRHVPFLTHVRYPLLYQLSVPAPTAGWLRFAALVRSVAGLLRFPQRLQRVQPTPMRCCTRRHAHRQTTRLPLQQA